MTLPQKQFVNLVQDMVTAWSNNIGIVPTLQSGDALLAIFQSVAAQLDYLQSQVLVVNNLSRAQTSTGADLDSWMAQFGFTRLPAQQAEGDVTLSSNLPAQNNVVIPVGTIVQTTGGAIQYQLIADTTQTAWDPVLNAYVLPQGNTSIDATAEALVAGAASNVISGQLNQFASSVSGVDFVTNNNPIDNGADAESDSAFLARFPLFLASLACGTEEAILNAANSVQQGLQISAIENYTSSGVSLPGAFTVVVDNGTGSPPSGLLTLIQAAVNAVRAFTVQAFVIAPTVNTANIALNVRINPNYNSGQVILLIQNAIAELVNSLPIGGTLYISAIESTALSIGGVIAVEPGNTTINNFTTDVTSGVVNAIRTTVSDIEVGTY